MSKRTGWGLVAAASLAVAAAPALLTSPGTTHAGWREELTVSVPDSQSGVYSITATDSTNTVDHTQAAVSDVANEPSMTLKNNATRVSGAIDVVSARATVPASNTKSSLLSNVRLSYDPTTINCLSGASGTPYWNVTGGALVSGTEYFRSGPDVTGDDLAPAQTKTLCPLVTRSGTDRDFLLSHGGRQLDIQTKVRQRMHAPATASSVTVTVNSRYQVKLPPPTIGADGIVCSRASSLGDRFPTTGTHAMLYWGWPFAADGWEFGRRTISTPAMNRFVVMRQNPTSGVWAPFIAGLDQAATSPVVTTSGDHRFALEYASGYGSAINSDWINNNDGDNATGGAWVNFKIRAFPYAGSTIYVDSDWIVQLREQDNQARCGTVSANPSSAPVGLG